MSKDLVNKAGASKAEQTTSYTRGETSVAARESSRDVSLVWWPYLQLVYRLRFSFAYLNYSLPLLQR